MMNIGKPIGQESHVIYAPNYVCTFDFILHNVNGVFGANHVTRINYIYSRLLITHPLTFWLPETAWLCQLVTHGSIRVKWARIYSATFFFHFLPFRLDLFQSCARPQTFHQVPKETNEQHGRKRILLEYIAIFLCIVTSREILSQHTFIVYRTLLIFCLSP